MATTSLSLWHFQVKKKNLCWRNRFKFDCGFVCNMILFSNSQYSTLYQCISLYIIYFNQYILYWIIIMWVLLSQFSIKLIYLCYHSQQYNHWPKWKINNGVKIDFNIGIYLLIKLCIFLSIGICVLLIVFDIIYMHWNHLSNIIIFFALIFLPS